MFREVGHAVWWPLLFSVKESRGNQLRLNMVKFLTGAPPKCHP